MIVGIGVDLVDARRILKTLTRFGERFLTRIFLDEELARVNTRLAQASSPRQLAMTYAKLYAAKEAVLKALGTGLAEGISWHHIELNREASGRPTVILHRRAKEHSESLASGSVRVNLSLTDEWPYAQAFVVLSKDYSDERRI